MRAEARKRDRVAGRTATARARRNPPRTPVHLAVLLLFSFQLIRFYVVIPLDAYVCTSGDHAQDETPSSTTHDHHQEDHEALEEALSHNDDEGYSFRHCKDTLDGMGLIPVTLVGLPVADDSRRPAATWIILPGRTDQTLENHLPPPFQPPRNLSQLSS